MPGPESRTEVEPLVQALAYVQWHTPHRRKRAGLALESTYCAECGRDYPCEMSIVIDAAVRQLTTEQREVSDAA